MTAAASPGDVPGGRPASLDRLGALTGHWEMEATFEAGRLGPGSPGVTSRGGRTTFDWLDGRFFLIQRFQTEQPGAPSGIAIIGAWESSADGQEWSHDFGLTYLAVTAP